MKNYINSTLKEVFVTKKEEFENYFDVEFAEYRRDEVNGINLVDIDTDYFNLSGMNNGAPTVFYNYDTEEFVLTFEGDCSPKDIYLYEDLTIEKVMKMAKEEHIKYQKEIVDNIFSNVEMEIEEYDIIPTEFNLSCYVDDFEQEILDNYNKDELCNEVNDYIEKYKEKLGIDSICWNYVNHQPTIQIEMDEDKAEEINLKQTIGCFYNNYITHYELKDGEDIVYIEEEIYYNKCLKPLFDDEEFFNNLMKLFDIIGVDEIRIRKDKDGKFTFLVSSLITNKDYYFFELEEDFKMGTIFLELQKQLIKIIIEQSDIQMISVIEGIGDMLDTMKKDNINEHTIHLNPLNNREDNLTCLGFDFINNKKLIKTKKEKQMYEKYCELKNKYNFKDIIFDREKFKVTFKF